MFDDIKYNVYFINMSKLKKVLILTDSVSLPRKTKDGIVSWEDTYVYKLKLHFPQYEFIHIAIGGATILDLKDQLNYYSVLKPYICVLQCGIVDCAPRAFSKFEKQLIRKFRISRFTKLFLNVLRSKRKYKYVSQKKFESALKDFKNRLHPKYFFSLSILKAQSGYEKKLKGVTENITQYNNILKKHSKLINLDSLPVEGILDDFHHINEIGHSYIKERITEKIEEIDAENRAKN